MATILSNPSSADINDLEEIWEWVESFDAVLEEGGPELAKRILQQIRRRAQMVGLEVPFTANTPYVNTIPPSQQPPFPGNQDMERRIKSLIRWNALAMVVRANRVEHSIGGHISTYGSAATLFEVGFNHFFRGRTRNLKATPFISRDTPLPAFMRARFWKAAFPLKSSKISAASSSPAAGFLRIPTPG